MSSLRPSVRFAWLLAVLIVLPLGACGGGSGGGDDEQQEQPEEQVPEPESPKPSSFIAADPGPSFDYVLGMDSFNDGGTVVCGWFASDHTWDAGKPTETTRVALGSYDGYVARYDPDGDLLWVQSILGTDFIEPGDVVALSDGSCILMGDTRDLAILAPGQAEQHVIDEGDATFVARYLADGTLAWVRVISGSRADVRDKCRFRDDSVGFCGAIFASAIFGAGEVNETDLTGGTSATYTDFVARYTKDGDLVYALAPSDGMGNTYASGLTCLPSGNVVVAGFFTASATFGAGTPGVQTFTSDGFDDGYIAAFSPTGAPVWARQLGGPGRELPHPMATLPDGTVALVGSFTGATMTLSQGDGAARTITGVPEGNTFLCRYNASGAPVWSTHIEHGIDAYLNIGGVVAFPDNSIGFVAFGPESVTVDPGGASELVLPAFDRSDLLLAKYGPAGDLVWARRDGGIGNIQRVEGVAAYPDGGLGLAGGYFDSFTVDQGGPGETTYPGYSGQFAGTDTFLVRYNSDGSHDGR